MNRSGEFVAYFTGDRCKCVFIEPVSLYVRAYHRTTAVFRLMKLLEIAETMLGYCLVTCPNSTHFFRYARYNRPLLSPVSTAIYYTDYLLDFVGYCSLVKKEFDLVRFDKEKEKNYSKYPGDVLFPGRSLLFRKMTTLRFVKRGLLRCRNWLFAKHSVSDTIFGDQSVNNSFVEILWAIL